MEVREGYKQTEVGVIPKDWTTKATALIVDRASPICYGVVQVGTHTDNGVPIVAIKFVKEIAHAPLHRTSTNLEKPYIRSRVKASDVLISIKGTIGRVGLVPEGFEGNISRELARLRINEEYSPAYIAQQLEEGSTQERISRAVVGTTRLEFSIASLREFELPLPPTKAEQEAIADALSDADEFIESLEQLIVKKRQIKQGAMQELLTGKKRLPGFEIKPGYNETSAGRIPKDWVVKFVGDVADITTGSKNTQDRIDDAIFPFFVRSQTVEHINTYSYDGEAVLTAGDGVGTGKVYHYIYGKFDVHQRVYRISDFDQAVSGYFFYLYFSNHFYGRIMQMTAKSSVDSIRMGMITKMVIPLPPTKEEQTAIATILRDMYTEITTLEAKQTKARKIKQGMMQELLTGRIRLV